MTTRQLFFIDGIICLVFVITCACALYFGDTEWQSSPTSKSAALSQPLPAQDGN